MAHYPTLVAPKLMTASCTPPQGAQGLQSRPVADDSLCIDEAKEDVDKRKDFSEEGMDGLIGDHLKEYYGARLAERLPDKFTDLLQRLVDKDGKE